MPGLYPMAGERREAKRDRSKPDLRVRQSLAQLPLFISCLAPSIRGDLPLPVGVAVGDELIAKRSMFWMQPQEHIHNLFVWNFNSRKWIFCVDIPRRDHCGCELAKLLS